MGPLVEDYVRDGIKFSNELLDAIETISEKYSEHINVSLELGHFRDMGKTMSTVVRGIIRYNDMYRDLLNEFTTEERKKRLETIPE
mgnify:FL=1|tara:strand:- start:11795 stop:12052 length:258 start_codon:yes stop_codon:yes gene_type:complete